MEKSVRIFIGRSLGDEYPNGFAGAYYVPGYGCKRWKNSTVTIRTGVVADDVLPAIIRSDFQTTIFRLEKGGRMCCVDVAGKWEFEEINVRLHYNKKEGE